MAKINVRDRNKGTDRKPNWEYRFEAASIDGKRKHISKSGFRTKKEALEAGAKALAEYNNCGETFTPSEISVSDYLNLWFKQYCIPNFKKSTLGTYRSILDVYLIPHLGSYKLKALTPSTIQNFIRDLQKTELKHKSIWNILAVFRSSILYAIQTLGFIRNNPLEHVKFKDTHKINKSMIYTDEQLKLINRIFPPGSNDYIFLQIGMHCGLRISEVIGLTWDDIDFETKTITVDKQLFLDKDDEKLYFTPPKYNSRRIVYFDSELEKALLYEKEKQDLNKKIEGTNYKRYFCSLETDYSYKEIFCSEKDLNNYKEIAFVCASRNGKRRSHNLVRINKMLTPFGIDFTYHKLRHTHATKMLESGANIKAVQQRLGHKDIGTTLRIYTEVTNQMQLDAIKLYDEHIKQSN